MCTKLIRLISFILVLMLAGNASAVLVLWDGEGDPNLWNVLENWDSDMVPGLDDIVRINIPDANCLIDSSVIADCMSLDVGYNDGPCYLNMTGGTLTTSGNISIGRNSDSNGVFNLSGGTVSTSNRGRLFVGYNPDANGILRIYDGEMNVADKVECGKEEGSIGYIYIYGGTLNVTGFGSDDFEIGKYGTGIVKMYGGVIDVNDNLKFGQGEGGTGGEGSLYMTGGIISAGGLVDPTGEDPVYGTPHIDISGGTIILTGDDRPIVQQYINNGWLIAHGGPSFGGRVIVDYNGTDTTITSVIADPNFSWNPGPRLGEKVHWTEAGYTLGWSPGSNADSHDVYFGTDWDDVNDANRLSPEFRGNQDPCSYQITGLFELGKTYYWRIDEVNDNPWAPPGSPWKGEVWSFKINDYLIVDDMESYGDATTPGPPPPPGSRIWYTWKDGAGWNTPTRVYGNGSGSIVVEPQTNIVHGGTQSMEYRYDNDGKNQYGHNTEYYSEISADTSHLVIGRDWTNKDVKALELWFYGDPNNDANATEQMYIKLNGVRRNYDGDMDDIKKEEWLPWRIPLADFGIDLTNVTEIAIGFGNENNTTPAGSGFVFFDNIRLYRSRCIPTLRQPLVDLDDDCKVYYGDLDVMSEDWLESDYIDVGRDGILENFPNDNSQWVDDPVRGRCLQFDGFDDWVDLNDADFSNFHDKTISLWVNIREFPETDPYIFCFRDDDDEPYPYRVYIREHGPNNVRIQFIGTEEEDYSKDFNQVYTDTWHHLAFVLRDTAGDTCTGEFYGDGTLIHQFTGRPRHSGAARSLNLGSWNENYSPFLAASIDDFRVYDAALSANNIKYLAEVPGGEEPTADMMLHYKFDEVSGNTAANSSTYAYHHPLTSDAELYEAEAPGSRSVNFKDFAILMDAWLEEQLWP